MGAIALPLKKNCPFYVNLKIDIFFLFCLILTFVLLQKNVTTCPNMSTGVAKIIQNESFKGSIFSNLDVNRDSLVKPCSSSGFYPA